MTRDEQLVFCRACQNRHFNPQQGIICALTQKPADFEENCVSYMPDQKSLLEIHHSEKPLAVLESVESGKRFATYLLDFAFIFISAMGMGIVAALVGFLDVVENINDYVLGFIVTFSYYVFFESLYGQSPGKMIVGTIVVTEDGKRPHVGTIVIRSLCRFIPFEAFSFFGNPCTGWHDTLSKTRVIRKKGFQYP